MARAGLKPLKVTEPGGGRPLQAAAALPRERVQRASECVDVVVLMTMLGVEQPGDVQNPRVKADPRPEQRAQSFPHRGPNELSVVIPGYEIDAHSCGERCRQGLDHGGVGGGDPVKLGDRLGVAAGEQAGTRPGHRNPEEIEGVAEEHQAAPAARTQPAQEVAERQVVGELVGESRAPGSARRPAPRCRSLAMTSADSVTSASPGADSAERGRPGPRPGSESGRRPRWSQRTGRSPARLL